MTGLTDWILLAEADAPADAVQNRGLFGSMWPAVIGITILYIFLFLRPQRQRDTAHKTLLENLKKNDRVVTIGGIYGTVTNVQRESDEVTLKVDEATNAKLRVTFNSIARVITEDDAEGSSAAKT
ncbi:MAG TPA: preprotein translocase subunit YajC [Pirellulales bacterium]|jgi:preprotein translocase subunit YajC|nr:preprotein translocase subunit YajC [Pirellulales bacterium]